MAMGRRSPGDQGVSRSPRGAIPRALAVSGAQGGGKAHSLRTCTAVPPTGALFLVRAVSPSPRWPGPLREEKALSGSEAHLA